MSVADYAALLRRDADRVVSEPQPYRTALNLIRELAHSAALTAEEMRTAVVDIFAALRLVQEDLDAREAGQ